MKIDQFMVSGNEISYSRQNITSDETVSFILVFTSRSKLESPAWLALIQRKYPEIPILSCSTSGEVYVSELKAESITGMAVAFESTSIEVHSAKLTEKDGSGSLGKRLASRFTKTGLRHLLVFSDGWLVNGSALIRGMYEVLGEEVSISGGLAGDGANFSKTLVGLNEDIDQNMAVAIGLYGDQIRVGFGSHGGWNELGQTYEVTATNGREVLKLDGERPLDFYQDFLGDDADGLPGTAVLYPVAVWLPGATDYVVRTVFNLNEFSGSLTLGEVIPEGSRLRFMKARFDDLLKGVKTAAEAALTNLQQAPEMALMVSCIGRKLLFNQQIEEEIEATHQVLGNGVSIGGFYSYGEICPVERDLAALHHQMLTLTLLAESS